MGDYFGRVDEKFVNSLDRIKKQLKDIGIDNLSDRTVSRIAASILEEIDFNFERSVKKRKDKIIVKL